jgi:hypothetical protein
MFFTAEPLLKFLRIRIKTLIVSLEKILGAIKTLNLFWRRTGIKESEATFSAPIYFPRTFLDQEFSFLRSTKNACLRGSLHQGNSPHE